MTYEEKLRERAEKMTQVRLGYSDKHWAELKEDYIPLIKQMEKIAALSLEWSAQDFEVGYLKGRSDYANESLPGYSIDETVIAHTISHGLKQDNNGKGDDYSQTA